MMMLKIAVRNIFRNTRRSVTTILTIAIGTAAVLLFGAYTLYTTYGLETATVQRSGHLTVYRNGYFQFGAGNPAAWGIDDYKGLIGLIKADPVLAPMVEVVTPTQAIGGIAGNPDNGTSKTFFGVGFVPSERDAMKHWNEYGVGSTGLKRAGIDDDDTSRGILGKGLVRILGLCAQLQVADCPAPRAAPVDPARAAELAKLPTRSFAGLGEADAGAADGASEPRIDLLGATVNGAPNVVSLLVHRVEGQGVKELDENYVGVNLALAQQLIYGRSAPKATAVVLQLHRSQDLDRARDRLRALFRARRLDLEVRDMAELNPFYTQARGLFRSIFSFISAIIAVVVLFTIANAMSMSVMERTDEIGTTRALGLRRAGVRRLFLLEGAIIGVLGATAGLVLGFAIGMAVNNSGLTWNPPGQVDPIPLRLYLFGAWDYVAAIWVGLVAVATAAAWAPAGRAARLSVVDALRHV
ncbi:MAG TPA: FtsX-like permease family protein [Phenylobacterium sp.]|nr:FtsX-like permease family protein [Phenylobacterium sp.]